MAGGLGRRPLALALAPAAAAIGIAAIRAMGRAIAAPTREISATNSPSGGRVDRGLYRSGPHLSASHLIVLRGQIQLD